jgi:hypothetical protein
MKAKLGLIFNISVRHPSAEDLIPVLIDLLTSGAKKSEVIFTQITFKGTFSQIWFINSNSYKPT